MTSLEQDPPPSQVTVLTVTSIGRGPNALSLILQGACGPDLAKMLKPVLSFEHVNSPTGSGGTERHREGSQVTPNQQATHV